jgi:DNA polymerase-3 subunit alpha
LSHCAETINIFSNINTAQIAETSQEREVTIGGLVSKIRYNLTKSGKNPGSKMAVFTLLDLQGQVDVVLFPNTLNQYTNLLANDKIIFVKGRLDFRREKPNVIASEIIPLDEATDKLAGKVRINLDAQEITKEKVAQIKTICQHHRGKSAVYVAIRTDKGRVFAAADRQLSVNPDPEFCRKIRNLVGHENLQLTR